jgi:hypothetical protein
LSSSGVSYLVLNVTSSIQTGDVAGATLTSTAAPTPPPLPTVPPEPTADLTASSGDPAGRAPTSQPAGFAPTAAPTLAPSPTVRPAAPIVLEVRTEAGDNPGSWLHIKADGETVFQKVLGPGQSLRYTAQRDVWVRAGNAAVVALTINGQPQPPLSTTPGDVVTFSWPP